MNKRLNSKHSTTLPDKIVNWKNSDIVCCGYLNIKTMLRQAPVGTFTQSLRGKYVGLLEERRMKRLQINMYSSNTRTTHALTRTGGCTRVCLSHLFSLLETLIAKLKRCFRKKHVIKWIFRTFSLGFSDWLIVPLHQRERIKARYLGYNWDVHLHWFRALKVKLETPDWHLKIVASRQFGHAEPHLWPIKVSLM